MKLIKKGCYFLSISYLLNKTNNKLNLLELPENKFLLKGNYENKIRQESTIEKIFEIFSTQKRDNQLYLSYIDWIKSIIPFNYTEIDDEKINKIDNLLKEKYKKPFYSLFDIDKSGDIDIVEYLFFNIIHRIDLNKLDKDLVFNKATFKDYLRKFQKEENLYLTESFILDPRVNKISKEDIKNSENNIINKIFKGKENISLKDFWNLKNNISEQIYYTEFWMLQNSEDLQSHPEFINKDQISKNIISFVHPNKVNNYFKSIDNIKIQENYNFNDFLSLKNFFHSTLIDNYFKENGIITKNKFFKLIKNHNKQNNIKMKENLPSLVFGIIDQDNSGYIDKKEYMSTIYRIRSLGRSENKENNSGKIKPLLGILDSYNIFLDKASRIYEILKE